MDGSRREALEAEVAKCCAAGDFRAAAEASVRGYGPEILGFLAAVMGNEADAAEVFSQFAEGVWKDLPRFEWKASLRTWCYAVARNAMRTWRSAAHRDPARHARESALDAVAEQVRTTTVPWLRTENKTALQRLRDALEPEDRMLLVLRVDRELGWDEIARIVAGNGGDVRDASDASDESRKREGARLRKRFQLVKDDLRARARREGLLGDDRG